MSYQEASTFATLILDHLDDALVLVDSVSQQVLYANRQAVEFLGGSEPEIASILDLSANKDMRLTEVQIELPGVSLFRLSPWQERSPNSLAWQNAAKVLDSFGIGFVGLDDRGLITLLNQHAMATFATHGHRAKGKPLSWLLPDAEELMDLHGPDKNPHDSRFSILFEGKTLVGSFYKMASDAAKGTALTLVDITRLQQRDFERARLLRIIIHDLSNPLNIALNFASLLSSGDLKGAEAAEGMTIVDNQLNRMQELLQDLSMLDKVTTSIQETFEPVNLDIVVAATVNDLQARAISHQIKLRLMPLPRQACPVRGNERLLRQAVHNLIENAIKYAEPHGWVRVTVRLKGDCTEVIVADDGIGIPPDKQRRLFAPFFRAHDPRKTQTRGTGLGLNLVQMIADQHNGQILLHSVPDRGSIFALRLPSHASV